MSTPLTAKISPFFDDQLTNSNNSSDSTSINMSSSKDLSTSATKSFDPDSLMISADHQLQHQQPTTKRVHANLIDYTSSLSNTTNSGNKLDIGTNLMGGKSILVKINSASSKSSPNLTENGNNNNESLFVLGPQICVTESTSTENNLKDGVVDNRQLSIGGSSTRINSNLSLAGYMPSGSSNAVTPTTINHDSSSSFLNLTNHLNINNHMNHSNSSNKSKPPPFLLPPSPIPMYHSS